MWVLHFPLPWKIMVCKKNEDIMFLVSLMIMVLFNNKTRQWNMAKGWKTLETSLMKLVAMLGIARWPQCHHLHLQKM